MEVPFPSFSEILSSDLNFQPAVKYFQMNTIDYRISEYEHVLKQRYPVESTIKHKQNLPCGNSGTYYAILRLYTHHQTGILRSF